MFKNKKKRVSFYDPFDNKIVNKFKFIIISSKIISIKFKLNNKQFYYVINLYNNHKFIVEPFEKKIIFYYNNFGRNHNTGAIEKLNSIYILNFPETYISELIKIKNHVKKIKKLYLKENNLMSIPNLI